MRLISEVSVVAVIACDHFRQCDRDRIIVEDDAVHNGAVLAVDFAKLAGVGVIDANHRDTIKREVQTRAPCYFLTPWAEIEAADVCFSQLEATDRTSIIQEGRTDLVPVAHAIERRITG